VKGGLLAETLAGLGSGLPRPPADATATPPAGQAVAERAGTGTNFQIVPLAGLPFVALALGGLVAAIATNTLWGLDFFHVVAGGLWTGIDLFLGFIIGPVLGRMSVPARAEFSRRFMPKMVLLMPTLVICTLAAGWQLARYEGNLGPVPNHPWVIASMAVVGVMAIVALGLLEPANLAVLFELKKPAPNGAIIGKLMKRFIYTAGVTGAMQVATLIIMTRLASR
jgi:hypothetical protein